MDPVVVKSTLNAADWRALFMAAGQRLQEQARGRSLLRKLAPFAGWLAFTALCTFLFLGRTPLVQPLGMVILGVAFLLFWWSIARLRMAEAGPEPGGAFLGEQSFEFTAEGFHARRANSESFNGWSLIREISTSGEHVFLWIDRLTGYVVPVRDLPAGLDPGSFIARLRAFQAQAPSPRVDPSSPPEAPQAAPREPLAGSAVPASPMPAAARPTLLQELGAVLRLFGFGAVDPGRLYGRELTLGLLGALTLALWLGLDRLNYSPDALFAWWGSSMIFVGFSAAVILAWVLARFTRPRLELRRGLLLVLTLAPLAAVAAWLAGRYPGRAAVVIGAVLAVEALLFLWRGLRFMSGRRQFVAPALAALMAAGMVWQAPRIIMIPSLWFEADDDEEQLLDRTRDFEELVFEQPGRIDAAIAAMAPRVEGRANAFFVGFAGYGAQRVFAQEIDLAARSIGQRYGASGRALQLVNDARDPRRHPLATPPALRHALRHVAARMDLEQDVLFLSLASHGSEDASVVVESDFGYWTDLDADQLATMLREAGIRWKVIVVSACYAGSFIEALRDDHTIVLAAAAADRTSFGCSDDSELTYFGEAFYQDALPRAATLSDAFERTQEAIAAREDAEGLEPSAPQAFFGSKMLAKLAELEPAAK